MAVTARPNSHPAAGKIASTCAHQHERTTRCKHKKCISMSRRVARPGCPVTACVLASSLFLAWVGFSLGWRGLFRLKSATDRDRQAVVILSRMRRTIPRRQLRFATTSRHTATRGALRCSASSRPGKIAKNDTWPCTSKAKVHGHVSLSAIKDSPPSPRDTALPSRAVHPADHLPAVTQSHRSPQDVSLTWPCPGQLSILEIDRCAAVPHWRSLGVDHRVAAGSTGRWLGARPGSAGLGGTNPRVRRCGRCPVPGS